MRLNVWHWLYGYSNTISWNLDREDYPANGLILQITKLTEEVDMADVDFNLSDISVISPENDVFVIVVISSLSLLGNIY